MIIVDSNVIIDILTKDDKWYEWSSSQLELLSASNELLINDIIYSEISIAFKKIEELEEVLSSSLFIIEPIPKEALFLSGKAFVKYKNLSGTKSSCLPDFFIGAQASVLQIPLLTRDGKRYRQYFPNLKLISP
jgi:predicted nucleic acid-binding protein